MKDLIMPYKVTWYAICLLQLSIDLGRRQIPLIGACVDHVNHKAKRILVHGGVHYVLPCFSVHIHFAPVKQDAQRRVLRLAELCIDLGRVKRRNDAVDDRLPYADSPARGITAWPMDGVRRLQDVLQAGQVKAASGGADHPPRRFAA